MEIWVKQSLQKSVSKKVEGYVRLRATLLGETCTNVSISEMRNAGVCKFYFQEKTKKEDRNKFLKNLRMKGVICEEIQ